MKKICVVISILFVLLFSFSAYAEEETFSYLLNRKIITESDLTKSPERYITRQEFIVLLAKAFDFKDGNNEKSFNDIPDNSPYLEYFSAAYNAGWLKGDEYGNLNPYSPLSRAEASAMLGRIAYAVDSGPLLFSDADEIPDWAAKYVNGLKNLDIIHGHTDNTFKPYDNLTFADGCTLVKNALVNSFAQGNGSKDNPFVITKPFHFLNIRLYPAGNFVIKNNLYFGEDVIFDSIKNFTGVLDGEGHKITGLKTTLSNSQAVFESNQGEISNLNLVCTDTFVSLCYENNGQVKYCGNSSFVYDEDKSYFLDNTAAIAVINNGSVYGCYNSSFLPGSNKYVAAGISYINNGVIENSLNTATGTGTTAGICYKGTGVTEFSVNTGDVTYPINYSGEIKNSYYSNYGNFKNGVFKSPSNIFSFTNKDEFEYNRNLNIPVLKNILYIHKENFIEFSGGDGSKDNPYTVSDAEEFMNIAKYNDAYFVQTSDIDMSCINSYAPIEVFSGSYDGNGFSILNLKLTKTDKDNVALFLNNNGTIKNLRCKNFYIAGNEYVSAVAVTNSGSIQNTFADGLIKGSLCAGISVTNNGFIDNTAFYGSVTGTSLSGGICLYNNSSISNCLVSSECSGNIASGISYENNGSIENSCFFGELYSNKSYAICYNNNSDIKDCYYKSGYISALNNQGNITAYSRTESQANILSAFDKLDLSLWKKGTSYPVLSFMEDLNEPEENFTDFAGGNGTLSNPYRIVSPLQLENIRKFESAAFILTNDIDMSLLTKSGGVFWGNGMGFKPFEDFSGVFFGNGKIISGLNINRENSALFLKNRGVITNLITDSFTSNGENVSGIVFENYGTVSGCINYSALSGESVSGIALYNYGNIYECINSGELKGNKASGISAFGSGSIENSLNAGTIKGRRDSFLLGGLSLENAVYTSLNTGDIYAFDGFGEIYPISKGEYTGSYYLDRYNDSFKGGLTLRELMDKNSLKSFNFDSVWEFKSSVPVLKITGDNEINLPHAFSGGNGSKENPFIIKSIDDLYNIRMYPNACYILANDITFDKNVISIANQYGRGFIPVLNFEGILDGDGHTIYGLEILNSEEENTGLFSVNNGIVKNLTLNRFTVEGNFNSGAVCGKNKGTIENVKVIGSRIGGLTAAGGIAGENSAEIISCFNSSDIFGGCYAGGIAGINNSAVLKSTASGGVIASSFNTSSYAGGIAGESRGKIVECENNGKVLSYSENFESIAGGLAGLTGGYISDSFNTGDITAKAKTKAYSGGIAGKSEEKIIISSCYNIGYGTASGEITYLGSVCAFGKGSVTKTCYDETLSAPVQEGSFTYSKVYPVTAGKLSSESYSEFFGKDIWTTDFSGSYPYPQLKNNPHREQILTDNIRDFAGGNGSAENPYLIMTAAQLDNVRYYLGSCFELLTDIDMTSYVRKNGFKPIGEDMFAFFGVFLGSEKTLTGLPQSTSGLFKVNHGDIYDLTLVNSGSGISDINTGLIYRCFVKDSHILAKDTENALLGGIANTNYSSGMIISSGFDGSIEINAPGGQAGGITSGNYGYILGCEYRGEILINANSYAIAGGIAAFSYGTVSDSLNKGQIDVNCPTQSISGGIVGTLGGMLINSVSYPKSFEEPAIAGNVSSGQVINCYHDGIDSFGTKITPDTIFEGFDFETMWYLDENNKMYLYW